jgi:hypothetical protein
VTEIADLSDTLGRLGLLFDRAVRALGDAGEADAAARFAAEAWWLLRGPSPRCARRLNATLHYLTLKPTKKESHVHQR